MDSNGLQAASPRSPKSENTVAPHRKGRVLQTGRVCALIFLLLVTIDYLVQALGLTSPVDALLRIESEGNRYWTLNNHFFTDIHGTDPGSGDSWDARDFLVNVEKPSDVTRIAVFGESAAIGEPPDSAYGFWRVLKVMLEVRFPERSFEVLPMAYHGTDSYCMYEAAKAARRLDPDFFVIYMGNNEVTSPNGVIGPFARLAGENVHLVRFSKTLLRSPLVRATQMALMLCAQKALPGAKFDPYNALQRMASYDPQGPETKACISRYRENLRDMCRTGLECGARVVASTVATNVRDWFPFYSAHGPDWRPACEVEWQRLVEEGRKLESEARYEDAVKAFQSALAMDSHYAEVHFRLGHCYFELGNMVSAREHYVQAREYDRLQGRAGNDINEAVRDVVREFASSSVVLADAEKAVAEASPGGIPGWEMFYDCTHMQFFASYLVARSVFDEICTILKEGKTENADVAESACTVAVCEERLALTPERRLAQLNDTEQGVLKGFREVFKHDWGVAQASQQRQELERQVAGAAPERQTHAYERALELDPEDHVLQARYLKALMNSGNVKAAYDFAARVCTGQPPYRPQLLMLGRLQIQMGARNEGLATLMRAASLYPEDREIRNAISETECGSR